MYRGDCSPSLGDDEGRDACRPHLACSPAIHVLARGLLPPSPASPPSSSPLQFTGKVLMKVMFIPFFQPSFDDEAQEEVAVGKKKQKKKAVALPSARTVTSNVSDKLKVGDGGGRARQEAGRRRRPLPHSPHFGTPKGSRKHCWFQRWLLSCAVLS